MALILTGVAALVLGMELPTTAAYLICVSVAGPALVELGLPELYAHLFVFLVRAPVHDHAARLRNVFIAAGIARAPWFATALRSMSVGLGLFIVPMAFVANPSLLQLADAPALAILALVKILAGLTLISAGVVGTVRGWPLRIAALAGGFGVIFLPSVCEREKPRSLACGLSQRRERRCRVRPEPRLAIDDRRDAHGACDNRRRHNLLRHGGEPTPGHQASEPWIGAEAAKCDGEEWPDRQRHDPWQSLGRMQGEGDESACAE